MSEATFRNGTSADQPFGQTASVRPAKTLEPLLVGKRAAAGLCGISLASWERLEAGNKIGPVARRLGGRLLYALEELKAWIVEGCPDRRSWLAIQAMAKKTGTDRTGSSQSK